MKFLILSREMYSMIVISDISEILRNEFVSFVTESEFAVPEQCLIYLFSIIASENFEDYFVPTQNMLQLRNFIPEIIGGKQLFRKSKICFLLPTFTRSVSSNLFRKAINFKSLCKLFYEKEFPTPYDILNSKIVKTFDEFENELSEIELMESQDIPLYVQNCKKAVDLKFRNVLNFHPFIRDLERKMSFLSNYENLDESDKSLEFCVEALEILKSIEKIIYEIKDISDNRMLDLAQTAIDKYNEKEK